MRELEALREVERLARECVDQLDAQMNVLHGECDADCQGISECGNRVRGTVECPKCHAEVDFEKDCEGEVECSETCHSDIALDLPDEEQETLRQLRLALVQLDLARAKEGT